MVPDVPILETERLTLRGNRREDLDEVLGLWSDPEVVRHVGGKVFGREDVWSRLLRYVGHWAVAGYGMWHVRERATGRFVGEAGLADFKRDLPPDVAPAFEVPEAGWVLTPWSHGRGYATEAMTAILAWHEAAGRRRSVCMIDVDNARSLRVAARLGYRELARTDYKAAPVIVLARGPLP